ncbi:Serpin family [Corchorus olitorius]|uniref:Serpin family n=1 Tax=Corchorus olitorius TaxID=93759 RepID=A0A1R3J3T7_9ROSI|nr:Serpin family [Corchorus olitorius]
MEQGSSSSFISYGQNNSSFSSFGENSSSFISFGINNSSNFNSNFCLLMANHMLQTNGAKGLNTVISPFSFHLMLSLIAAGSKGRTLEQLFNCLGSTRSIKDLNSQSSQMIALASPAGESSGFGRVIGDPELAFVNGVWVGQGLKLKPSFQEIVKGVYNATAKEVDFVNKVSSHSFSSDYI